MESLGIVFQTQLKAILAKHMGVKEEWIEQASERDYYMKVKHAAARLALFLLQRKCKFVAA